MRRLGLSWMQFATVFVGGGLLISLGDRVHIEFGVLTQADTSFLGQAWWVVPMFGGVSLTLIYSYRALRIWLNEPESPRSPQKVMLNATLFLLAYGSTGPFAHFGFYLAALLAGLWVARILLHRENRATLILAILIAALGPLGEVMVATFGLFQYTAPDFGLVHSWLPAVYLHGGLVVPAVDAFLSPASNVAPLNIEPPPL